MSASYRSLPKESHNQNQRAILVFTATFNESENIERLCKDILATSNNVEVLVVDDNSPDGTGDIVRKLEK